MIINRGLSKKWSGMMITEHVQKLKEWQNSIGIEYPKEKTDWEWEDIQNAILSAYKNAQRVELRLWQGKWVSLQGIITTLKSQQKLMIVETDTSVKKVAFHEIDQIVEVSE